MKGKKKAPSPMDILTAGYEKLMIDKKVHAGGKMVFQRALKRAIKNKNK